MFVQLDVVELRKFLCLDCLAFILLYYCHSGSVMSVDIGMKYCENVLIKKKKLGNMCYLISYNILFISNKSDK